MARCLGSHTCPLSTDGGLADQTKAFQVTHSRGTGGQVAVWISTSGTPRLIYDYEKWFIDTHMQTQVVQVEEVVRPLAHHSMYTAH